MDDLPKDSLVKFTGVLYDVRVKRDGGGRIQIDFGADAFEEVLMVQRFFKDNNINVAMALVPYQDNTSCSTQQSEGERGVDPDQMNEIGT